MSLIKCPACRKQISNKVKSCPHCEYSFNQTKEEAVKSKVLNFRRYRDKMYRYKMLTFTSIAIAIFGLVPMLWTYAQAIDYGFNASMTNHWGIYFIYIGFVFFVLIRILMFISKSNYKSGKIDLI